MRKKAQAKKFAAPNVNRIDFNKAASRNQIIISDTHCGCKVGLCCPEGLQLDGGGTYMPSKLQKIVWEHWEQAWYEWVPKVTHGEPFMVIHNGDAVDGVHHNSTTQITHCIEDQIRLAEKCLKPVVNFCDGRYYHIRGTEAHVGQSGEYEEDLAKRLGAIPNEEGQYARFELWKRCGTGGLVQYMHHIGTTGSSAYESTAVYKELVEAYVEAGRWGDEPPQAIVRSHRHRNFECRVPCSRGYAMSLVTGAWQLKTPFTYKIPGGRIAQPQIGMSILRQGDEEMHARHLIWRMERPKEE